MVTRSFSKVSDVILTAGGVLPELNLARTGPVRNPNQYFD
jgi:hypothetical protein